MVILTAGDITTLPRLEPGMRPRLGIIIVNYRTAGLVIDCLKSLVPEVASLPGTRVIVVDNASGDGSADRLATAVRAEGWSSWAELMPLERNRGFSAGNDAALQELQRAPEPPEWLLLLNPDTVVRPGALERLLHFGDQRPEVGIVGSRLEDPDGTPQWSAFRFPGALSTLEETVNLGVVTRLLRRWRIVHDPADAPHACDWVAGASMLVRHEVLETVGLLDEGYFLYFEEVDFCLRAARAGWRCWYEPASRVVHLVGQSTGVTDVKRGRRRLPTYWFDSRRRFFLKNYGPLRALVVDATFVLGSLLGEAIRVARGKASHLPERFLGDFLRNSVFVRGFGL